MCPTRSFVPALGVLVYVAPTSFAGSHIRVSTLDTWASRVSSVGQIEGEGEAEEQEEGLGGESHIAAEVEELC